MSVLDKNIDKLAASSLKILAKLDGECSVDRYFWALFSGGFEVIEANGDKRFRVLAFDGLDYKRQRARVLVPAPLFTKVTELINEAESQEGTGAKEDQVNPKEEEEVLEQVGWDEAKNAMEVGDEAIKLGMFRPARSVCLTRVPIPNEDKRIAALRFVDSDKNAYQFVVTKDILDQLILHLTETRAHMETVKKDEQ